MYRCGVVYIGGVLTNGTINSTMFGMDTRRQLQYLMQNQNLSIRELSRKSGVRRLSIMRFLDGGNIHLDNLQKVLTSLGYNMTLAPFTGNQTKIKVDRRAIAKLCKQYHVRMLALFGSVLRNDFSKESDIDILVDFEKPIGFFELADFETDLRHLFHTSHPLDVVTVKSLSPLIAGNVINSSEVVYDKAA